MTTEAEGTQEPQAGAPDTAGTKAEKSDSKADGFYCYIGPNIRGYWHTGQIFRGERDSILTESAQLVEKHPLVKALLVPGGSLSAARLKVKEPGTAHYANYQKLQKELLEAAQEKVMPEYLAYQKGEAGNV